MERRKQPNQKTNPPMITRAKNYTKQTNKQKKPDRTLGQIARKKAIQTKPPKETYTYTLT